MRERAALKVQAPPDEPEARPSKGLADDRLESPLPEHRERLPHPVHRLRRNRHRQNTRSQPKVRLDNLQGSTSTLGPPETGGAWRTPASYTPFSIAGAAFSTSHCSVLCSPGTQDEHTSKTCESASASDLANAGKRRS